ncbi:MAG: agmatine deiminase family protein [Pirellulales bacterium]
MVTRRRFISLTGGSLAAYQLFGSSICMAVEPSKTNPTWRMPDESALHRCTWMAFGANEEIWDDLLDDVRENLATIAKTISKYEPVLMLVRPDERKLAAKLCGDRVKLVDADLDDLWIRDTGPTFVLDEKGNLGAVDLNFNGWGEKQDHEDDAAVAELIAENSEAIHLTTKIVGEGGGLEVDGEGTAIVTESCFLNDNRNPGIDRAEIEAEFKRLLGLRKIIWLPGVRGKDITDGHTDFYARFASPGVVVAGLEMDRKSFDFEVTRNHLEILRASTDAHNRKLEVMTLESPQRVRHELQTEDFAAGYINFYVVNGAVIAPQFGDVDADAKCKNVLTRLFPNRKIVQLNVDAIAAGGGGIHCATQQQPRIPAEQGGQPERR